MMCHTKKKWKLGKHWTWGRVRIKGAMITRTTIYRSDMKNVEHLDLFDPRSRINTSEFLSLY